MTVTFSREELAAAGITLDDSVDFDMAESGDITLHAQKNPKRSVSEYTGILDGFSADVDALRNEWGEREHRQWKLSSEDTE